MVKEWCGIFTSNFLFKEKAQLRLKLAEYFKTRKWDKGLKILKQRPDLVNIPFLDDPLWFAPLHQGAYNKAPLKVIQKLLSLGAWRTLKTIKGEKPVDLCPKGTQEDLVKLLTPIYKRKADQNVLSQIEKHFHEVIIQRIKCLQ